MVGDASVHNRQWSVGPVSRLGKRREIDRARTDVVRNVRRRVLQECAGLRGWRRRFRGGRIVVCHPVRFQGLSNPSPR